MRYTKKIVAIFVALVVTAVFSMSALVANASPPLRENWQKLQQPNGDIIFIAKKGDARFHWFETRAGYVVVKNEKSGVYEFAEMGEINGEKVLLPSGVPANDNVKIMKFVPVTNLDIRDLRKQVENRVPH